MKDIDLSGVHPRRWPEIRRRVEAIEAYLALGGRNGARRDAFATELGLHRKTFLTLVKTWRDHGDASLLQASGVLDRGQPRPSRGLPPATREAILRSIAALGVDARHVDMVADVYARCDAANTKRPSTGMVQRLVTQARRDAPARPGEPEILIGRIVAKLPVSDGDKPARPDLLVAVLSPEGAIVAHTLDFGDDAGGLLQALLEGLRAATSNGASARPVLARTSLIDTAARTTRPWIVAAPTSSRIARLLGHTIGQLEISHRRKPGTHAGESGGPKTAPLGRADAISAVRVAVDAHNVARGSPTFSVSVPETQPVTRPRVNQAKSSAQPVELVGRNSRRPSTFHG